MKPGTKLKSVACNTEVMVIKGRDLMVECGGLPMIEDTPAEKAELDSHFADGTLIGKRYVDAEGSVELLCTKAGDGSLALGGAALSTKDAKPLPSSD